MKSQKELFSLDENVHYLNCAFKAPLLKSAEAACINALIKERNPFNKSANDFFETTADVRSSFGKLINAPAANIAIIPSTSYGFSSVLLNVKGKPNGNAITIQDEFPSGYFALQRWSEDHNNELIVVKPNEDADLVGKTWNEDLLKQINEKTSVVLISSIHWMNGLRFDLEKIGQKCKEVGAIFIVDGTQSVGALSMDVKKYNIHALVCATYKWLFGPYSIGLAYISDDFESGRPIEESWMNRKNAKEFSSLVAYDENYESHAGKYNVGETSNFILMPMLLESLMQVAQWQPAKIQGYCRNLIQPLLSYLKELGVVFEPEEYFSSHLFSLRLPGDINLEKLQQNLSENKIYISVRGELLRVAVNVFNEEKDIQKLIDVIRTTLLMR